MNEQLIKSSLLIIAGLILAVTTIIFLLRKSNKTLRRFQLYPESKSVLSISLSIISWIVGIVIFLIFLRLSLRIWGLEFTAGIIEGLIVNSPKYIIAIFIIVCGFYVSRIIKERIKDYEFDFKDKILVVVDFIIHMTFVFTAFYTIGLNITFFIEFYKVVLWIIGIIVAMILSISIGIPLGMEIHYKITKERKNKK